MAWMLSSLLSVSVHDQLERRPVQGCGGRKGWGGERQAKYVSTSRGMGERKEKGGSGWGSEQIVIFTLDVIILVAVFIYNILNGKASAGGGGQQI